MIIREATVGDAPGIARVHVDSWRTTYRGLVSEEYLSKLSYEARERFWTKLLATVGDGSEFVYVAVDDSGRIAGFTSGGKERSGDPDHKCELYAIYLLEEHQGKGVGRSLMQTLARRLQEAGYGSLLLWVLAENPARKFYETMGGKPVRSKPVEIGERHFEEIGYGWRDIRVITGK